MNSNQRKVKFTNKSKEDIERLGHHTPENYLKVILQNDFLYNSIARADIAQILHEQLQKIRKETPDAIGIQKNLFLEIFSKLVQISEDLALLGEMFLYDSKDRPAYQIYMEANSSLIKSFYTEAKKGFCDRQLIRIMGLDKIKHYIESNKKNFGDEEIKNYEWLISESIKIERENMRKLANINVEEVIDNTGKKTIEQAGTIHVYNGIKHGFKVVYATPMASKMWPFLSDSTVDVMHRTIIDEETGQKIIALGGFGSMSDEIIESMMHNVEAYSDTIRKMCELRLWADKDPMFVIKRLRLGKTNSELKVGKKVGPNDKCPCGSNKKYKKCCQFFEYEYNKSDPYSVINEDVT